MIVSWNWLTDFLRLDMPVEALTERLALTGLNHESTEDVGGDLAIDLEVTSNRPDCLGHIGVAREISVLFNKGLCLRDPRPKTKGKAVESLTGVTVEAPDLCPRFTARVVTGAKIGPSPWRMRKRLETLGVRPISNVVDATNYVMFECGQPLHAYDLPKLAESRLVVRRARSGESLTAINGKKYALAPDMLTIADAEKPVGLAGVMGGFDTEISEATTDILLEAALFDAMSIRRTSRALGLFSPSSYRFERPMDFDATEWASRRCAELILETAGGILHPGVIDVATPRPARAPIVLRLTQIERVLGISIPRETVLRILGALGLEHVGGEGNAPSFLAPSWRSDLDREIDLIEEVARIHGYEHIPEDRAVPLTSTPRAPRERVETEIRNLLTGLGFDEACTFSLVSDELAEALTDDGDVPPLRVEHQSRKKESALRRSLVPSLLNARRHNEARGNGDVPLFEIAGVYLPTAGGDLPDERARIGLTSGGDFFGLKGVVEALLARFHLENRLETRPAEAPMLAKGRRAELFLDGKPFGYLGELAKSKLDAFDLREACAAAELDLQPLIELADLIPRHEPLPAFPAVSRDLSLSVSRSLTWAELSRTVKEASGAFIESVDYLDTFQGGNLPEGRQSVHFGLRFRHPERTLTGEEVEQAVQLITDACRTRHDAVLRS